MPVASFVATGTACGRHPVAARARGVPLPQTPPPPARFISEDEQVCRRFSSGSRPPKKSLRAAVRYRHPLRRRRNAPSLRSFPGAPWSVSTLNKMKREAAHSAARPKVSGKTAGSSRTLLPSGSTPGRRTALRRPSLSLCAAPGRPAHLGAAPGKHAPECFNFEKGETRGRMV